LSIIGAHSNIIANLISDSDHRAELQQQELLKNVAALLETNQALSRRLMNLEDAFEVGTIVSKRQSRIISTAAVDNDHLSKRSQLNVNMENGNSQRLTSPEEAEVSSFDFENDLETSRPYRRAQRDSMDFSFRSSIANTNAWSQFSGLSLSKVSIISAIALPLYPDEIENAQHYELRPEQPIQAIVPAPPRARPLYQSCLDIKMKLSQISGFPAIFALQSTDSEEEDPLTFLMQVFRRGIPLLMLLARIQGVQNISHYIQLENYKGHEQKIPKVATFKFIEACIVDLSFQFDECFTISDLFGNASTGFVKVDSSSISIHEFVFHPLYRLSKLLPAYLIIS
jgi:cell division control protein 24